MDDRGMTYAQGCIAICMYILEHGSITPQQAQRVSRSRYRKRVWRMLREIDGIMTVYREGRRVILLRGGE